MPSTPRARPLRSAPPPLSSETLRSLDPESADWLTTQLAEAPSPNPGELDRVWGRLIGSVEPPRDLGRRRARRASAGDEER